MGQENNDLRAKLDRYQSFRQPRSIQSSMSLTDDHNLGSESEEYNDRCERAKKMKRAVPRNTDREFDSENARVGNRLLF